MAPNAVGSKKKSILPIERDGIKAENPEKYYEFGDEIGRGKFSVVKYVTNKSDGKKYAAKIIKFDDLSLKFAIREYDLMVNGKTDLESTPKLYEAYLVRKYLIIVMTLCDGKSLLEFFANKHSITEDDIAIVIRQLCTILAELHSRNVVHLDIRPTNIRLADLHKLKMLDFNSARHLANKKAGEVVDVIGDTEFCAPEMLSFDRVQPGSDMWSVAVIMYILLSGISPYYYADENQVSYNVEKVLYSFDKDAFEYITVEAQDFIKKIFKRGPEMRLTAAQALSHKWLSEDYAQMRKRSIINRQDAIQKTDARLYEEEEEEYVAASLVFRTFEEEENVSPEEESSDEEED